MPDGSTRAPKRGNASTRSVRKITLLAYAARHIQPHVSNADWGNLSAIAAADLTGTGRVRITNAQIAAARSAHRDRPLSEHTVRIQTGRLVREGRWLRREGRVSIIPGYAEHNVLDCTIPACIADSHEVDRVALADELATRRREAARVKKARQRAARMARLAQES